ncbi:Coenzyme PQQ synthesis protein D [Methylacidimicrobium sp. AP8]|uniref:pyrroloquinoline quinone biosynthesis peptide chaperone PqqD n=1 Tax=Methylacidimicrobium sp. AP8 TaxID=2730359 RepID=UPI0018C0AD45|nr:pyrroloquinoline quinone biosynthesis peptide chaperone PqqD [Methylacidimicrobium sp. AP8]CAB4243400.1 Coenzyme PQQ synthesis protein D [Methylacidimicrobium sp. AP8]
MDLNRATPRLASKASLRWDAVRKKPILLYPEGVLILNRTAEAILSLCDGRRAVPAIVSELASRFGADPVAVQADVWQFLEELRDRGLLLFAAPQEGQT